METTTTLKSWLTREEIERMFFISTATFNNWRNQGKFGLPVGELPASGPGRRALIYDLGLVMALYEKEKLGIFYRARSHGVDLEGKIDLSDVEPRPLGRDYKDAAYLNLWLGWLIGDFSEDDPYYDGLPKSWLWVSRDRSDILVIPGEYDFRENTD